MNGDRLDDKIYIPLEQEQFLHRDMVLSESPGGINFARRYLWIINWANKNYKFDFLLRVDDDYFICMDRLFLELPYRKVFRKLYWGHVHCHPPGKYQKFKHSRKLIDWLIHCLMGELVGRTVGWWVGRWVGGSVGGWIGWLLIALPFVYLFICLSGCNWFVGRLLLVGWLFGWPVR